MVHASQRYGRGQRLFLVVGGLVLAGLGGLVSLEHAASAQGEKEGNGKKGSKASTPARPLPQLAMTIASKDPDVAEMSKLINTALAEDWKKNKITPSNFIDDYEFIRRASLDIIGRIARPDEIRRFRKDPPERRRSMLIERLLKHEDYPRHWANLWANWLLTRSGEFGRGRYHEAMVVWLEDQFARNRPYNEIVTKLLTATGAALDEVVDPESKKVLTKQNGAVNFFLAHLGEPTPQGKVKEDGQFEMVPLTSRITRVFLGIQVQCAQCHPHPFATSLKQESFWGINAFLRQVKREGAPMRRQQNRMMASPNLRLTDDPGVNAEASVFFETRAAKVRMQAAEFLPATGATRTKKDRLDPSKNGLARREDLALRLTDHDQFSRAIVNRMWGLFFGRGFVNPIDDFNDNNQPSHPELLNELAQRFKHYNFDLQKLIRWITHSNAYHLSYVANKTNDKVEHETQFSRMIMKSLSPEQLFESMMAATQRDKAMQPADKKKLRDEWMGELISNFGDDEGNEVNFNGTIVQALLMMNGKNINGAIGAAKGTVATAMATKKTFQGVVEELYLAGLNRPPRASELRRLTNALSLTTSATKAKDTPKAQYEDIFWALLNSNEFLLNH